MNALLAKVTPVAAMRGEDVQETQRFHTMLEEARQYVQSFSWCVRIDEEYFGLGVGGIVAVFLFRIRPTQAQVDEWMWVIVGDLPSAYITTDIAPNPASALDGYIGAMEEWVDAVKHDRPVAQLIPVNVPASLEMATKLEHRLSFLNREILPRYAEDLEA